MSEPNYYAIIPANVRYAKIPDKAKLLYWEITALCNKNWFSRANNNYFANLYWVHKNTISRLIWILEKNWFIKVEITKQEKWVEVSRKMFIGINKNVEGGINKNVEDNNTSYNITKNKYKENKEKEILDFYNLKSGKQLKLTQDKKEKIKQRLKTWSIEDINKAISNWCGCEFIQEKQLGNFIGLFRNDGQIEKRLNRENKKEKINNPGRVF